MYGSNNYKESLSKSQAGIPRKVKFGPYIFPICISQMSTVMVRVLITSQRQEMARVPHHPLM